MPPRRAKSLSLEKTEAGIERQDQEPQAKGDTGGQNVAQTAPIGVSKRHTLRHPVANMSSFFQKMKDIGNDKNNNKSSKENANESPPLKVKRSTSMFSLLSSKDSKELRSSAKIKRKDSRLQLSELFSRVSPSHASQKSISGASQISQITKSVQSSPVPKLEEIEGNIIIQMDSLPSKLAVDVGKKKGNTPGSLKTKDSPLPPLPQSPDSGFKISEQKTTSCKSQDITNARNEEDEEEIVIYLAEESLPVQTTASRNTTPTRLTRKQCRRQQQRAHIAAKPALVDSPSGVTISTILSDTRTPQDTDAPVPTGSVTPMIDDLLIRLKMGEKIDYKMRNPDGYWDSDPECKEFVDMDNGVIPRVCQKEKGKK